MKKRILCILLVLTVLGATAVRAAEITEGPVEIHSVEDLRAMAEAPSGSYVLMEDLDMTGVEWIPVDFTGNFDGNGHAILNLTLTQPGLGRADSQDGNYKSYDTTYAGLFGTLRGATVANLKLINVRALVETDEPCFLGGITGYMEDSTISGCTVTGTLELRAHDRMFGVGGVAGFGGGAIVNCGVDVTLICTDTDPTTLDEQFMGGVYATGFIDVIDCDVTIDGYCSEYGYVHNGGIVGMYMQYIMGHGVCGYITGNTVTGKITFFECNTNRRAYCEAYAGEVVAACYRIANNTQDFLREEVRDYTLELRPEMCQSPVYTETVTAAGCDSYGYTRFTCQSCGYSYTDRYTLFAHTVAEWTVAAEPTAEAEGLLTGHCPCGMEFTQTIEKLEPEPTEGSTAASSAAPTETQPEPEPAQEGPGPGIWIGVCAAGAAVLLGLLLAGKKKR